MKNAEKIRPNEISEKTKASMKTRIIAGIVGLVIIVPPIIGGDWFFLVLSAVLLVISLFEIINVTKVNGRKYSAMIYVATILCGVAIAYWPIVLNIVSHFRSGEWGNHIYEYFTGLNISVPAIFICVCILFLTSVLHETFSIRDACYLIAMVLVASIGMQALLYVRYLPCWLNPSERPFFNSFDTIQSSGLFAYAILGAFATDIGAYFTGIFFGKKKINEK